MSKLFQLFKLKNLNLLKSCLRSHQSGRHTLKFPVNRSLMDQKCLTSHQNWGSHKSQINSGILFGGVLSLFGYEKEEEEKEPELITTIKRAVLLIQKEKFKEAEQMLHVALKLAQEQMNEDGITYIYDVMANLAYDTGDFAKAEKLFVNVMQRLLAKGIPGNDNKLIHISLKIASVYEARNDLSTAEDGYKFCVENLKSKINDHKDRSEDTLMLWSMALDMYGRFLLSQNRYKESLDCFTKAFQTFVEVHGRQHEQAVVLLNNLGTVSSILGNWDQSLAYFQEAVDLGKTIPDNLVLGSLYVNLGQSYLLKEVYDKAEIACQEGKRLGRRFEDKETESEADKCLEHVKDFLKI